MDEVYVVEVATSGPRGIPENVVAEIAVCKMLSDGSDFDLVYNDGVALDPLDLGKDSLDHMQSLYGIEPEDLYRGSDASRVTEDLTEVLSGMECTSYNVNNVFGRYLDFSPWDLVGKVTLLPSISVRLHGDLRGPPETEPLLIREAYRIYCPDDPAQVGDGMRAIHLTQMAVSVLMVLRKNGML